MLQTGGINVFRKMVNPLTQFLQMVIFGVQTSWVGQRTPKTINHRWSMPHHYNLLHAVVFFFFFFHFFLFFFLIFHKNYTRNFFSEPWDLGLFQIAKYHIFDALWHWKGGSKVNALWDTFYHLFNPIMHHIYPTMYQVCDIHYCNTELIITTQH